MGGVYRPDVWEPTIEGEVISDYQGSPEDFEASFQGFYSLGNLRDLDMHVEKASRVITGEILPYGIVVKGERGYRSTKAKVLTLYKGSGRACYICGDEATYEVKGKGEELDLCRKCRGRLWQVLHKKNLWNSESEVGVDIETLKALADTYGAGILEVKE